MVQLHSQRGSGVQWAWPCAAPCAWSRLSSATDATIPSASAHAHSAAGCNASHVPQPHKTAAIGSYGCRLHSVMCSPTLCLVKGARAKGRDPPGKQVLDSGGVSLALATANKVLAVGSDSVGPLPMDPKTHFSRGASRTRRRAWRTVGVLGQLWVVEVHVVVVPALRRQVACESGAFWDLRRMLSAPFPPAVAHRLLLSALSMA